MRSWVKYEIVGSTDKVIKLAQDYSFSEHANAMGYYKENEFVKTKHTQYYKRWLRFNKEHEISFIGSFSCKL